MTPEYEQKLARFSENADFAIFDGIQEIVTNLDNLAKAIESSKTEEVSVTNIVDAKTDLTPLEANFKALNDSIESVTKAIQAIPKEKEVDFSGIENILKTIAEKKVEQINLSELTNIAKMFDEILYAFQTIASNSSKEKPIDFKQITEILSAINDNIVSIDIPFIDYQKLAKIIKDNVNIKVSGGSATNVRATLQNGGADINAATFEKQNQYQKTGTTTDEPNQGYAGHQFTIGYIEDTSRGFVSGASIFSSYGLKTNAGATTRQPVHPTGVLNLPGVAGVQMAFVSTSANDTSAGTGIQQIRMSYVEAVTLTAKTEIITLNGTTPVNSVATNILFVNDLRMTRGGSGAFSVAAGTIDMTGVGTGTFYGRIEAGSTLQKSAFRMVPAGKRFVVKQIFIGSVSTTADTYSIFELVLKIGDYFIATNGLPVQNGSQNIDLWAGTALPAGTIFGAVETTTKASLVSCSFIGILENA